MQHHKLQVQEVGVARHQVYPPYHRLLSGGASCLLELETKVIRRFAKVSIVSYSRPSHTRTQGRGFTFIRCRGGDLRR